MDSVSANNQIHPTSGDEPANFTAYSSAIHRVVVMVNTGSLGILQIMNDHSPVFETHRKSILSFYVLVLLYSALYVWEATDVRLRPGLVARLVGCASHLFGGLSVLVLISVFCASFAMFLLVFWFIWLCTIIYYTLNEFKIYSDAIRSGINSPPSSVWE